MAMIRCPECGARMSDQARACMQCGGPIAGGPEGGLPGAPLPTLTSLALRKLARYAVLALLLGTVVFAWVSPLDGVAGASLDAALQRSLGSFGLARELNSAISLAQGTEVGLGEGATTSLGVGAVLDPLDDLTERYSDLALLASLSFGMQGQLLQAGQHWAMNAVLTVLLLGWGAFHFFRHEHPRFLTSLVVFALFARFAMPLAAVGTGLTFAALLEPEYRSATLHVDDAANVFRAVTDDVSTLPAPEGAPARLDPRAFVVKLKERFTMLRLRADQTADDVVRLMVVFCLEAVLLPLLLLWGFHALVRNAFAPGNPNRAPVPPPRAAPAIPAAPATDDELPGRDRDRGGDLGDDPPAEAPRRAARRR